MDLEFLSDDFAVTGQIAPRDLASLKEQGFKSVFCHRPDEESEGQPAFEEIAEAARALGLDAHHLPVVPGQISEEEHAEFRAMMDAAQGPVLAYCKSGGRAKALWMRAKA